MSHQPHPQQPAWGQPQQPGWGPPRPQPPRPPKKNGPKIAAIGCAGVLGIIVIAGVIGTATGNGSKDDTSSKPPATSSAPELTDEQRASIAAAVGLPPEPDLTTRTAYVADLDAIDKDIVHGKTDKAVDRGLNQCRSIKDGKSRDELIKLTNYRFTSPDHPNGHGTATSAKILDVVHKHLCPDF